MVIHCCLCGGGTDDGVVGEGVVEGGVVVEGLVDGVW